MEIRKVLRAMELPESWDRLAIEYFQTTEFLDHTEKYNPCNQRYYTLYKEGILITGLTMYSIRLNLFTYLSIPSPFRMHIVGIPCSVSSSGIIGSFAHLGTLIEHIKEQEKGLLLVLNMNSRLSMDGFVSGRTLPTVILEGKFETWESYTKSLRADYRRRIKRLSGPFSGIRMKHGGCSGFDEQMYDQYLGVLKRSKGKLETLSLEFFQNLPSGFHLTTYCDSDKLIGWFISRLSREKHYFFLGGIDYKLNRQYKTYFNILFEVLREGIEKKSPLIDLGQTAEIPKIRMGGTIIEKYMLGYHSNWIFRKLLLAGKSLLEYPVVFEKPRVFKEQL
ncbi:MAG: GNAT family N-acetyltransferase [Bacteroidota bacterium]